MNNSFKLALSSLVLFGFFGNCAANAASIADTSSPVSPKSLSRYYVKIAGELNFPSKLKFDVTKAPLLVDNGTNEAQKSDTGFSPSLSLGYVLPQNDDIAFEVAYRRYQLSYSYSKDPNISFPISSKNDIFEVAALYTLMKTEMFAPYIRLSAGLVSKANSAIAYSGPYVDQAVKTQPTSGIESIPPYFDNRFAFGGAIGFEVSINSNLKMSLAYDYHNLGTLKMGKYMLYEKGPLETMINNVNTTNRSVMFGQLYNKDSSFGSSSVNSIQLGIKYVF